MTLHGPWLELSILFPLLGALWVSRAPQPEVGKRRSIACFAVTLLCTIGAWADFLTLRTFEARDRWYFLRQYLGPDAIVVDELSAPLLSLAALLFLLTAVVTLRTKMKRFSFTWTLVSEAVLLAVFSCKAPWGIIGLVALGTIPPYLELRARRRPTQVYVVHMAVYLGLLVAGYGLVSTGDLQSPLASCGILLLAGGVLVRCGVVPGHCWVTHLFEQATFGTALLFVTPMVGAYLAVRLVFPIAPDGVLRAIALIALATAVYTAGMALIQREARRFFCYLFLSHSSLVLVGLETATPVGLTGALSVWLSVGLALTGFGLTLRSLEARIGRLSLASFHGLYEHTPTLALLFLLTGLASVGFPGTFGFVGTELLVDGIVHVFPFVGMAVVLASALNGIAVLQTYFRLFGGATHGSTIDLRIRPPEYAAVLLLTLLILGGGLFPQPGISSRYRAAMQMVRARQVRPAEVASVRNVRRIAADTPTPRRVE